MAAAHPGPIGLLINTIQRYLDDRKWLYFERGMMTQWNELYLLTQNSYDPTLSMLGPVEGRYSYKTAAGTVVKAPPTNSRLGAPGSNPLPG